MFRSCCTGVERPAINTEPIRAEALDQQHRTRGTDQYRAIGPPGRNLLGKPHPALLAAAGLCERPAPIVEAPAPRVDVDSEHVQQAPAPSVVQEAQATLGNQVVQAALCRAEPGGIAAVLMRDIGDEMAGI